MKLFLCLIAFGFCRIAAADVVTETVKYEGGGAKMEGLLALKAGQKGKRPGVLVVHEWWGHNDYARGRAKMLAELGYAALAIDMYGEGKKAEHPKDAAKFMNEVLTNMDAAEARFRAAATKLKKHPMVDPTRTAAIGYCFGGAIVLHMARAGEDLDAVVSFHGNLTSKITPKENGVKAKILVLHGAADPFVPQDQVTAFKQEMDAAKADYTFIAYPGAKHAFTNPGASTLGKTFKIPLQYDASADQKSWSELQKLFSQVFR